VRGEESWEKCAIGGGKMKVAYKNTNILHGCLAGMVRAALPIDAGRARYVKECKRILDIKQKWRMN
jgi:hypothetical protein